MAHRGALSDRFWSKVDRGAPAPAHAPHIGGCWVWTGGRNRTDYGQIFVTGARGGGRGGMRSAHRVSWELAYGPVPAGLFVCHHCDNPPCVRPDHLFLGTAADNTDDCLGKGRNPAIARVLSADDVASVRRRVARGERQAAVARVFGVSQPHVSRIASGARRRTVSVE